MSRIQIDEHELRELLDSGALYEEIEAAPAPPVSPYLVLEEALKATLAELANRPIAPIEVEGMRQLMVDLQAMTLALNRPTPIPVVQVAAPNVQVPREISAPDPRVWESEVTQRDEQGKIKKIVHRAID